MTKVAGIWNANAESCAPAVADCHSGGGRFGNSLPSGSCSRRLLRTCSKRRSPRRTENLGAICFGKPALRRPVWPIIRNILLPSPHKTTDLGAPFLQNRLAIKLLNAHITPKSSHKYRLSAFLSEQIDSQSFKLAQCSQIGFPGSIWEHQESFPDLG